MNAAAGQLQMIGARRIARVRRLTRQCAWLFAIALFGYPIVGNLISVLQVDSRQLSVPFRILVALFSVWLIAATRGLKFDRLRLVMLLIWFLYTVRLLHDWFFTHIEGADYALQFFVASSVLPALALMKARAYEQRRFALAGFFIASAGAFSSLIAVFYGDAGTAETAGSTGRLALSAIDSVSLGHLAVSGILCGIVLWRRATWRFKLVLLCAFASLLWCLMLTGSKGPALALFICMGLWAIRRRLAWRFILMALPLLVAVLLTSANPLAERLSGADSDQSTVDRLVIFSDSFKQIAGSPWIGSAFVELNSGYYPHDVFVEAALAFGIPVALLFLGMMLVGAFRAWGTLKTDVDLLGMLFIQGLVAAAVSGAIFGSTALWVTLAILPTRVARPRRSKQPPIAGTAATGTAAT